MQVREYEFVHYFVLVLVIRLPLRLWCLLTLNLLVVCHLYRNKLGIPVNILGAHSPPKAAEQYLANGSTMLHMTFPLSVINMPLCAGPQTPLGPNSVTASEKRLRRHGNA